jgi:hypothetical protein
MLSRQRWLRIRGIIGIVGAILMLALMSLPWTARWVASQRSYHRNRPQIVLDDDLRYRQIDSSRVALSDGRVCKLVDVVPAEVSALDGMTAEVILARALEGVPGPAICGLRVRGTNSAGETLVEVWHYSRDLGGCGSSSYFERWKSSIPHWHSVSWMLVGNGMYRVAPDHPNAELDSWQEAAIDAGDGAWAKSQYLKAHVDLQQYEAYFDRQHDHHTNGERMRIARRLLRIDPATYQPKFLALATNDRDDDGELRAKLAQLLHDAGEPAGTDYLLNSVRGKRRITPTQQTIIIEYAGYWNLPVFDDVNAVVSHYDRIRRR